uniref:Uncharacterized protein n=1 Tax=viral metagenome TaxID=1070528 RepID=A0A6C0J8U1_9ZZZZ
MRIRHIYCSCSEKPWISCRRMCRCVCCKKEYCGMKGICCSIWGGKPSAKCAFNTT